MKTVKLVLFFLCCGLFASVVGYGIDGFEASIVFGLYFGPIPLALMPIMACIDSLQCRYRRWRRNWKGIIII